jgi:rubrerythrin
MNASEDKGNLNGFLAKLVGTHARTHPIVRSELSMGEVLRCLADIEADATAYYEELAEHTDLPWVRDFALGLAKAEKQHQDDFLEHASRMEGGLGGGNNRLHAPLSDELVRLLSERITLSPKGVERTAVYLGEKDAVELAIQAERRTVRLLTQLRGHVHGEQRGHLDRVLVEEQQHQSFLENLHREHFGGGETG